MEVSVNQSAPSYTLQHAVLLYGASPSAVDLVTINRVINSESGPIIGEGRAATKANLSKVLESFQEQVRRPLRLLHPNVIAQSDECMVWWEEASVRRVVFSCKEIGKRAAKVPNPPLLFIVARGKWYVFAMTENRRPTGKTVLSVSPYFNVWEKGLICTGTTKLPSKDRQHDPDAWSDAFFRSAFTHPNIRQEGKLVRYETGSYAFWQDMLDGKFTSFPNEVLVRTKTTVQEVLETIQMELSHA